MDLQDFKHCAFVMDAFSIENEGLYWVLMAWNDAHSLWKTKVMRSEQPSSSAS